MTVDLITLLAFVPAALALILTPGNDMLFCMAQGMRSGPRAGIAASVGVSTGGMIHATLAGLGLGVLIQSFPWVFGAIRWGGVAYLLYLAWKTLNSPLTAGDAPKTRAGRAFRDGMLVNLSNPKVILFFLAFIPQFVDPTKSVLAQFLILGGVLCAGAVVINGMVGAFAGRLGRALTENARLEVFLRRVTAGLFAGLAARIGWEAARG